MISTPESAWPMWLVTWHSGDRYSMYVHAPDATQARLSVPVGAGGANIRAREMTISPADIIDRHMT